MFNSQSTTNVGMDSFNKPECFEFWYGADHAAICQNMRFPSPRQRLFLMCLVSNLHLPLKKFGVTFPYEDTVHHQYLLKPKKRFIEMKNYQEVQLILDTLKDLPRQFQVYQQTPCVKFYLSLEKSLKQLLLFFSIPQEKQFFETLKKKTPAEDWERYEAKLKQKELEEKNAALIQEWRIQQVSKAQSQLPKLSIHVNVFSSYLSEFKSHHDESRRFISGNQKESLVQLYYECMAWLSLLTKTPYKRFSPFSIQCFELLTFKEAGALIEGLELLSTAFERQAQLVSEKPLKVSLSKDDCMTGECYSLLRTLGIYFPHFSKLANQLSITCLERDAVISYSLTTKVENEAKLLRHKLNQVTPVAGFHGFKMFSVSEEFLLALEIQGYLTDFYRANGNTFSELDLEDLSTHFTTVSSLIEPSQLPHTSLENSLTQYFNFAKDFLEDALEKNDEQALVYEEMIRLLDSLPMAPITL